MRNTLRNFFLSASVVLAACSQPTMDIYVSPGLKSQGDGSIEAPFSSVEDARDYIRSLSEGERKADITVHLRGGNYILDESIRFGIEDGAPEGYTYTYKAYLDETPVLCSDVTVEGWGIATELPDALKDVSSKIYMADIPESVSNVYVLYDNDKIVQRCKKLGFTIEPIQPIMLEKHGQEKADNKLSYKASRSLNVYDEADRKLLKQFRFSDPKGILKNWDNMSEIEVGFAPVPWSLNLLPLESIDFKNKVGYFTMEANAPAGAKNSHTQPWVENVLEYLEEGTFATYDGKIYYWPSGGINSSKIVVPTLKQYILVEGEINYDGPQDIPVRNLVFDGLTFTRGTRDTWESDHKGWGIQHDWDRFDHGNAMLRLRGAENCTVNNCRFTNSASSAIRLDLYAQHNTISNNLIDYVGHMGILLCGYGPGTKDVNKQNLITNNLIHHVGQIISHGAAIFMWQSGENTVSHNKMHHLPRKGVGICGIRTPIMVKDWCDFDEASKTIRRNEMDPQALADYKAGKISLGDYWKTTLPYLHSRNNVVEYNEVYRALEKLADGSVLNVSGAGEGNIVRNNYVHHIASHASGVLRTDDWQRGTTFEKNIIHNSNIAAIVHKGYNHVVNNLIVDCSVAESIRWASYPDEEADYGSEVKHNIFYESGNRANFYRESYRASEGISLPNNSQTDNNIFWVVGNPKDGETHIAMWNKRGVEESSVVKDPQLRGIEDATFDINAESPVYDLGFEPIDVAKIGLTSEFPQKYLAYDYEDDNSKVVFHRQKNKKDIYDFW